jgi:4-alpha-glucanotransferase
LATENLTAELPIEKNGSKVNGNGHSIDVDKSTMPIRKASKKPTKAIKGDIVPTMDKATLPKTKKQIPANKKITNKAVLDTNPTAKKKVTAKTKLDNTLNDGSKQPVALKITFQLKFQTTFGQNLFITGNHPLLGDGNIEKAIPLQFYNYESWCVEIDFEIASIINETITYNYILRNLDASIILDWGTDKTFNPSTFKEEALIIDGWNHAGYIENAFYTVPFQNVLLKANRAEVKVTVPKTVTHTFQVKAPLLAKNQTLCLLGAMNNWDTENPILMNNAEGDIHYKVSLDLTNEQFPIAYKYGVYNVEAKQFVQYEDGNNRFLYDSIVKKKQTIVNDAFAVLPSTTWKGAGIAIPVFSLRSNNSFGVGEFADMKPLVDWSKQVGLKLIQILPINDTTATHSWMDSYPYAAISAFALHPIYLNLHQLANDKNKKLLASLEEERIRLNSLETVDYAVVMKTKMDFIKKVYPSQKEGTFQSKDYQVYFEQNKHWLVPYAVFCYLRDEYGTSHFNEWPAYRTYNAADIQALTAESSKAYNDIALNYFIQYHLHLQLKEVTEYAHENGIVVKGDIAIGIYRYGTDAWQNPELYHLNVQAGAPPDDFAVKGQNWGFPTYNWQAMKQDGFAWWKQRFEQMGYYFDAFRIDHILGFFRIWSIPTHAVEGIMGYFVPAIPVHVNEFNQKGIWFNQDRYARPYITDAILWEMFGHDSDEVKINYLNYDGFGNYNLKSAFTTQRQVEKHFAALDENDFNNKIRHGLYDLISNVVLFEVEGSNAQEFHFRFGMEGTSSFKNLDNETQQQLKTLYINYFFRRQDDFWKKEAMEKLPALKRVTNMLICGEDLGLVPECVPDVMQQLCLLSLEIQRMPKDPKKQFFHPNDAPYLSVVTPSTHDMSTIRGWWEEDRNRIQKFYNHDLGQWGNAPQYCEAWINKAIVMQHLYSPAMWSIFQLQDLLGSDADIRRKNPTHERINIPANPKHYWRYRMHMNLEDLQQADSFNEELKKSIEQSGR